MTAPEMTQSGTSASAYVGGETSDHATAVLMTPAVRFPSEWSSGREQSTKPRLFTGYVSKRSSWPSTMYQGSHQMPLSVASARPSTIAVKPKSSSTSLGDQPPSAGARANTTQ